jgi:acyl-CoA synthetase (NDP forming)
VFNPLDVASFGSSKNTPATAPVLAGDPSVDAVVAFVHKLQTPAQRNAYAEGLAMGLASSGKPHLAIAPAELPADQSALLLERGVAVSSQTGAAFTALRALFDTAQPGEPHGGHALPPAAAGEQRVLNEWDSMAELDAAGVPTVPRERVASAEAAIAFGERVGGRIVLKGLADGIAHKSDIGLVHLDLQGPAAIGAAQAQLLASLASAGVPGGQAQVVAQAMVRGELEVIVGVTVEPSLGRFLLVGTGGRQAEFIDDVRLWSIPVSADRIRADLAQTAVGRILQGHRWARPASLDELLDIMMKLQSHVCGAGESIRAIEINPLSMSARGTMAVDALVIRDAT